MGGGGGGGRLLAWGFVGGAGRGAGSAAGRRLGAAVRRRQRLRARHCRQRERTRINANSAAVALEALQNLASSSPWDSPTTTASSAARTRRRRSGCQCPSSLVAPPPSWRRQLHQRTASRSQSGDVFAWGWSGPSLSCKDGDNNEPGGAKSNSAGHPSRGHTVRNVHFPWALRLTTIAAGERHALAVTDGGDLFGWGTNAQGQLGLGPGAATFRDPQLISCQLGARHAARLSAVACGSRHSVALTEEGEVVTFGWGLYGQCGHGTLEDEPRPRQVTALGGVRMTAVAAGLWHTACCTEAGEAYAWGGNQFGQLGTGGDLAEVLPKVVDHRSLAGNDGVRSIHCGARHTAALTDTRRLYCWGWNKYGQLGTGSTNDCDRPTEVFLPLRSGEAVQAVACGWWHTLAVVDGASHCLM
eukprot:SM000067S20365  [mRNA]  locus=s67:597748:600451:+ [translate_table: standard]